MMRHFCIPYFANNRLQLPVYENSNYLVYCLQFPNMIYLLKDGTFDKPLLLHLADGALLLVLCHPHHLRVMHPPEDDVQGGVSVLLLGHAQRDDQLLVDPHRPDPVKVAELVQLGHVFEELLGGRQRIQWIHCPLHHDVFPGTLLAPQHQVHAVHHALLHDQHDRGAASPADELAHRPAI